MAFSAFPIMYSTETFYWFGDNNYTEWEELFNLYQEPPYQLPKHTGAYSFGIAGEDITFAIIFARYVAGTFFSKSTFNSTFYLLNLHSEFNCQLRGDCGLLQLHSINYGSILIKNIILDTGAGTGVPFHFHGPGFGEVIYGRKRWFLYPPNHQPKFHPNRTTLHWLVEDYPRLLEYEMPYECTLEQGDVRKFIHVTSMHSSRMGTARLLTVSRSIP